MSDRRLRVGLVMEPKGIDDPYNHGAYLGLERAVRELGIRGRVLTPAPKEGYVPSLSLLARQKYDLVIGFGFLQGAGRFAAAAIDRAATGFPETKFAIIDYAHDDLAHRPTNVVGLVFREEQAGYLAGHLAALVLTLSPGQEVISSVGGERVPSVERWIAGYQAGARGANPRVTTLNSYTDDFLDRAKGRSVALSQIAKGSRVVFQVAGVCGLGALEAASEHGIWGIGVDVDQSHLGPHILTSAVKRLDVAVFDTIEQLVRGTLETGRTSRFSLRNRGVGLGPISAGVPRSLQAQIEDVRAEI
ncbi:MAG: BMP family lipoprotein, partial [Acidimicrobiia bacterium]